MIGDLDEPSLTFVPFFAGPLVLFVKLLNLDNVKVNVQSFYRKFWPRDSIRMPHARGCFAKAIQFSIWNK